MADEQHEHSYFERHAIQPAAVVEHQGPLCGIFALQIAAAGLGRTEQLFDIYSSEYVTGERGSTIGDLVAASKKLELYAYPLAFLGLEELENAQRPALLNVKAQGWGEVYDHWITYLGFDGNKIHIYDPLDTYQDFTVAELLSNWNGTAILISDRPFHTSSVVWYPRIKRIMTFAIVLLLMPIVARLVPYSGGNLQATTVAAVSLILVASFVAVVWHTTWYAGFVTNSEWVASVVRNYVPHTFPLIEVAELMQLLAEDRECLIVDSRLKSAYEAGHIPGAKSIPIDAPRGSVGKMVATWNRSAICVVYCQSETCEWDSHVAAELSANGMKDVRVLRGGWVNWQKATPFADK